MLGRFWITAFAVLSVLVCLVSDAAAQRSRAGDNWTFGIRCRMSWDAAGATYTLGVDPQINTSEGSAAWSDPSTGALVLYSDGIQVWSGAGAQIFTGLPGNPSSMHSAVVAPVPGTPGEVYVFAHAATASSSVAYQRFSVTGTPAAVGSTGTVTLPTSEGREGMLLIPHANGTDAWLLISGRASIFVVPITAAGVGAATQITSDLLVWSQGWHVFAASPQGTTVVMSGNSSTAANDPAGDLAAWTFDPSTGVLSNRRVLNAGFRHSEFYGGVFSPNGRRFYFSLLRDPTVGRFVQYDFDTDAFTVLASATSFYYFGDGRRAPDGRIYVAGYNSGKLHVVNAPDAAGAASSFVVDAITPPSGCTSQLGISQTWAPLTPLPPTISQQPQGTTLFATQTLSLSVVATGQGLSYQWRKGGAPITGADQATYAITATVADAGSYDVVVSNVSGSVTSDAVTVVVHGPPSITTDPSGTTIFATQALSLSVVASGQSVSYQWRKGGAPITGADQATYAITATVADAGSYDVVVTNPAGSVTSAAATVVVHGPPAITTNPGDATLFAGQSLSLSVVASGQGLTYQWRKGGAPITGADQATYAITATVADAGSYDVVVTNPAGNATSTAAAVVVHGPPSITTSPMGVTVRVGAPFSLTVVAVGEQLTYQWRRNGSSLAGETAAMLSRAASLTGDAGDYDVVVTNPAGAATSAAATVVVQPIDMPPDDPPMDDPGGCGCHASRGPSPSLAIALLVLAITGRRRRRSQPNVRSSRS